MTLHQRVEEARARARAPISQFLVGAAAEGLSGSVYLGFNLEIPGLGLQHTVHAEQAAVALAHWGRESGLRRVAVSAPPCGHCRQFLREIQIRSPLTIELPQGVCLTLEELLPHSFGPEDLGSQSGLLEVTDQLPPRTATEPEAMAREAALCSWSPYTRTQSGVALRCGQRWWAGSYLENAAFNPSLNPVQYALVRAVDEGHSLDEVEEILFWERSSQVSLYPASLAVAEVLPRQPALRRLTTFP